jgi:hypothetical protein
MRRGLAKIADHPRTSLIVGLIGLLATVAGLALALFPSGSSTGVTSASESTSPNSQQPLAPLLSSNASCSDFQDTSTSAHGTRLLVDSPGRIGGGSGNLKARLLPDGEFLPLLDVSLGSEVEV